MKFRNWTIGTLIGCVTLLPLTAFLLLAALNIQKSYSNVGAVKEAEKRITFVRAASAAIHEMQKERGKSVAYLNKNQTSEELAAQKALVDEKFSTLSLVIEQNNLASSGAAKVIAELSSRLKNARENVLSQNFDVPALIQTYTSLVGDLIATEISVTQTIVVGNLQPSIRGFITLELAKESAGRLRANLVSILASNLSLNESQMATLLVLMAGIENPITSPTLSISPAIKTKITDFLHQSADWKKVVAVHQRVLRKADSGQYGEDPKAFFSTLTQVVDQISNFVDEEITDVQKECSVILAQNAQSLWRTIGFSLVMILFLAITIYSVVRSINRKLTKTVGELTYGATQLSEASHQLQASSTQISAGASEAAASLQETSAALVELSSTVRKNAESATEAKEIAQKSNGTVILGKSSMMDVNQSIVDIRIGQKRMVEETQKSNERIGEVVQVIKQIGDKTKVINDIVFQTKLLSFNASVEAARAGEHGKGFAVVAEEIGALAKMSGEASKEISGLLQVSTQKVESIVNETRTQVQQLLGEGTKSIDVCLQRTDRCQKVLEDIVQLVDQVNQTLAGISTACGEQSTGIEQISQAVSQLDQVTQENTGASNESARAATGLWQQAASLQSVVNELNSFISSKKAEKFETQPEVVRGPQAHDGTQRDAA